jgi:hypothetical protein
MKTIEEILDELVEEPDNYGNGFEWLCTKEEAINCMESYASEQTEKYKELIDVMDKLYEVSCDTFYELEIDPTEEMGKLYIKIQLLKTELGL